MHHQKKDRSVDSDNKPEKPEIMTAPTSAVMTIPNGRLAKVHNAARLHRLR
jgi:hypothetical protein